MTEAEFALWVLAFFFVAVLLGALVCAWLIYWVYRAKLLQREERREMIERGMTPPQSTGWPMGWPAVKAREQELVYEERRLRIEKGLPVADEPANVPRDVLQQGLVSLALGLGLAGGYIVFKTSGFEASDTTENWFLFFGVISPGVVFYGIANIIHYRMTRNRTNDEETSAPGPVR
jgi:hypothetical protein